MGVTDIVCKKYFPISNKKAPKPNSDTTLAHSRRMDKQNTHPRTTSPTKDISYPSTYINKIRIGRASGPIKYILNIF